jgi:hypothetical protein
MPVRYIFTMVSEILSKLDLVNRVEAVGGGPVALRLLLP